jgi:type IV secretory pathway VirB10-like protein
MLESRLAITDLFKYPTVAALAAHIRKANDAACDPPLAATPAQDRAKLQQTRRANEEQQRQRRQRARRDELSEPSIKNGD